MSNRVTIWRYVLAAVLGILLGACEGDGPTGSRRAIRDSANEFVPADAFDRRDEEGAPWVQISFNARRKPFEFAVDLQRAAANGWKMCRPKTTEWTGYEDASHEGAAYTQHIKYLFYKGGIQVTAISMYHSENEHSAVRRDSGDRMPIQQVFLVAGQATDQRARAEATELSLVCD